MSHLGNRTAPRFAAPTGQPAGQLDRRNSEHRPPAPRRRVRRLRTGRFKRRGGSRSRPTSLECTPALPSASADLALEHWERARTVERLSANSPQDLQSRSETVNAFPQVIPCSPTTATDARGAWPTRRPRRREPPRATKEPRTLTPDGLSAAEPAKPQPSERNHSARSSGGPV
jgi:hypothetical protein